MRSSSTIHNRFVGDSLPRTRTIRRITASTCGLSWLFSRRTMIPGWRAGGRVRAYVAETGVEGDDGPAFALTHGSDVRVRAACETLAEHGLGVVPRLLEQVADLGGNVLI